MDIQSYIDSGILELYALGQLQNSEKDEVERHILQYPEIKAELNKIEHALENLAISSAINPDPSLIYNILERISATEPGDNTVRSLPLISQSSDYKEWIRFVEKEIPVDFSGGCYSKVLQHTDHLMQMLLVSSTDFDDEVHHDLQESFLILQGRCKCTVGDSQFFMEAGDFAQIPLHELHRVELLTQPVIAILQRVII